MAARPWRTAAAPRKAIDGALSSTAAHLHGSRSEHSCATIRLHARNSHAYDHLPYCSRHLPPHLLSAVRCVCQARLAGQQLLLSPRRHRSVEAPPHPGQQTLNSGCNDAKKRSCAKSLIPLLADRARQAVPHRQIDPSEKLDKHYKPGPRQRAVERASEHSSHLLPARFFALAAAALSS